MCTQHGKNALEWIMYTQDTRLTSQLREELCQALEGGSGEVDPKALTYLEQELLKPAALRRDSFELLRTRSR